MAKKPKRSKSVSEWSSQLRSHALACRASVPLPKRDELSPAEDWQRRIVGSSLVNWLRKVGPRFLQERAVLSKLLEIDREPFIVFTSDIPGLVAASEILGANHERAGFLLEDEFDSLLRQVEDPNYCWHVHVWSVFRKVIAPTFEAEARTKYPIPDGSTYWQHSEGTMWAVNAGRGGDHLWRWDGQTPELLEEALTHWVS